MVEAGGVGIFRALKTRKLLILLDAQNSRNAEIAPNWNVSGTRDFHLFIGREKREEARPVGFEPAKSCKEDSPDVLSRCFSLACVLFFRFLWYSGAIWS